MSTEGEGDQTQQIESGNAGGDSAEVIAANSGSTQGDEGNQNTQELPPELKEKEKELLRGFHAKTQALAEKERMLQAELNTAKQDASALYDLSKQEWFKNAVESEKARRRGQATEITAEQFESLKSDPRAFSEYLSKRDQAVAASLKSQFQSELEKLTRTQSELLGSRAEAEAVGKFGDEYKQAKESGALAPYLDKYEPEVAFKLYSQDQGKVAGKRAAAPAPNAKGGTVEKGGMVSARGGPVVEAKSLDDALDRAFDLARRGVKDYSIKRK